jgi:hypothetical protein
MLRNPNSISANDILIEDPLMEPLFITKSDTSGYTLYERVKTGKSDKDYIKTIGYFSNFGNCLKRASKELVVHQKQTHYSTVREYLKTYSEIEQRIKTLTDI